MTNVTNAVIEKIKNLLEKANFETFVLGNFASKKSKFCFDLLAKKVDMVFCVKIFPQIDNLNSDVIYDIKSLSTILKSKPLLIGIRNRYQNLEDNTIYIREDLPFITLNTFENILDNKYPYILARRGGGVVFIDGTLMKTLRENHSITRKELSDSLGVTKRTIGSYENESMRPSEKIAEKLLEILENSDLFKKINVFGWHFKSDINNKELVDEKELSPFEARIQDIVKDIGLSSYWYKKGSIPFKLSLYSTSEKDSTDGFFPLFSGISEEKGKINAMNFKCLTSFTNLFHKTSLFIIDDDIRVPDTFKKETVPIIKIKNLEEVLILRRNKN